ncbi:uncharacterized protein LOC131529825 isoform X8 [Onychostoma macrolepis]|uniref:uncharacterized protein LOC131529825 isoform X8 n=1 Tax=Onychostoma macrolepis TaxID=369639 RepID=UPI00272A7897|nr:uncharacterized protein LOC131529825 isoform X8 [Onychostoma macrolepis]
MKSALTIALFPLFAIGVFADGKETSDVELESVMEGDSVTLKSGVTKIQTDDGIEWRFSGSRIAKISSGSSEIWVKPDGPFKDRLQLDKQTGDLKISNIRTTDSGQYKLKISSTRGSPETEFTVKVVSADGVKTVSVEVTVLEGDSVTLRPDLTEIQRDDVIQWRFGQQKSPVADINRFLTSYSPDERFRDRLKLDNQTGSLTITNIIATDSGLYEAEISNSTSSRYTVHHTQSFTVTVSADVESVSVLEGDSVTLRTGLTEIQRDDQILWKFGDQDKLIADLNETWRNIDLNSQTRNLTISNIRRGQSGHYKVEIITRRMILHRKYRITIGEMKSVSGTEGESVTLQTVTEIQNDDLIHWMFGDNVIAEIHKADRRFYTSDVPDGRFRGRLDLDRQTGSLIIMNTRTTHSGEYQLKISSSRRTINRRITVTVSDPGLSPAVSDPGLSPAVSDPGLSPAVSDPGLSRGAVAGIVGGVVVLVAAAVVAGLVKHYRSKISELERRREENGQNLKKQETDDPAGHPMIINESIQFDHL